MIQGILKPLIIRWFKKNSESKQPAYTNSFITKQLKQPLRQWNLLQLLENTIQTTYKYKMDIIYIIYLLI